MINNLWVPLSGAMAQEKKIDTIANNIANSNSPGFKKDQLVFKEYLTSYEKGIEDIHMPRGEWKPEDYYKTFGAEHAFVKVDGSYTNFKQGSLRPTSNPLDVAITGPGFFVIETPAGLRFTRKGNFSLNADSELVTDEGFKVLGNKGSGLKSFLSKDNKLEEQIKTANIKEKVSGAKTPSSFLSDSFKTIKFNPGKVVQFDNQGGIYQGENKISDLALVNFTDTQSLKKEGHSHFANHDKKNMVTIDQKTKIHQGFMEESNVNVILEMTELIKANRHFENMQKAIKTYDQLMDKTYNDLAKF